MLAEYEIDKYEDKVKKIEHLTKNLRKKSVRLEELKMGQNVIITFCPNSQKYIYLLTPKYGKIVQVSETGDFFNYKILSHDSESQIECLFHPKVSYYNDSLGYDYFIDLVES